MSEKRKEHRLRAYVPIKLTADSAGEFFGRTENISRLGTYVESPKEIPAGAPVKMVLELPAYSQKTELIGDASCSGTVFRCGPIRQNESGDLYGLGIFFTDFDLPSDKNKISSFVDYLIEKEEKEIKEGIKRRKEKETAHIEARHKDASAARQEAFEKEAMSLLKDISARLENITRLLSVRQAKK